MTALAGGKSRDLVPRWRRFGVTTSIRELESLGDGVNQAPIVDDELPEAIEAFRNYPGVHTASDVVGRAVVVGAADESVRAAARFLTGANDSPQLARELAGGLLTESDEPASDLDRSPTLLFEKTDIVTRVKRMRQIVRREPRNAVRWADLSLAYLNLGTLDKARKAMQVAVGLSPRNRYIVRSAVRLYLVLDDLDMAKSVLSDDSLLSDPWIQAADLAVSEISGRGLRHVRLARSAVEDGKFLPWHTSELASELATIELRAGRGRQARRFMRMAALDPTENTVAQLEWLSSKGGLVLPIDFTHLPPFPFEARALAYRHAQDYKRAFEEANRWHHDQPFASEAAMFASYLAAVGLEDYAAGASIARRALIANPGDSMLRNNLVFALANDSQVGAARAELSKITMPSDPQEKATLTATHGLVAFREGNISGGREFYRAAVEALVRDGAVDRAALARGFWAREELTAGTSEALDVLGAADDGLERSSDPEATLWLKRLKKLAGRLF